MQIRTQIRTGACIGAMALLAGLAFAAQDDEGLRDAHYRVFDLGTLGGVASAGNTVNDRGWVMGTSDQKGDATTHAALWIDGFQLDLGTLGGPNSAVEWPVKNDRGVIAGIAETAKLDPLHENWSCSAFFPGAPTKHVCVGFVAHHGRMEPLPTLGGNNGYAAGVNNRGDIVGWAENTVHDATCAAPQVLQFEAVVYHADGSVEELPPYAGDPDGAATDINDQGQVVGISGTCDNAVGAYTAKHALLWEHGVATEIKTFGGAGWNTPTAINNRGEVVGFANKPGDVVGGVLQFNPIAFVWTKEGGTKEIAPLPGDTNSIAYGINERGQVVGQSFGGAEGTRAFLWEDGKAVDVNALREKGSRLYLLYAEGINDRGEITGQACVPVNGACTSASEVPAYLAARRHRRDRDEGDGDDESRVVAASDALNGQAAEVRVSAELVRATLRGRVPGIAHTPAGMTR